MNGRLYGVGVGPGDPELLTLKAVRVIEECDIIAVPGKKKEESVAYQIANQAINDLNEKSCMELEMPMTKDQEALEKAHDHVAKMIMEKLDEGKDIAFLTLGDPTIYSTYLYIHERVKKEGYPTQIISGIPSFCAAAAKAGIGLVEKNEMLHLIPAVYEIEDSFQWKGTKVYMKAGKSLKKIKEKVSDGSSQIVMVENCGMDNEFICTNLEEIPEQTGYYSLLILKE